MRALRIVFLGFTLGVIFGYYIVVPGAMSLSPQGISLSGVARDAKLESLQRSTIERTGRIERIDYNQKFILLSLLNQFEPNVPHYMKIYLTDTMTVGRREVHMNNGVQESTEVTPFVGSIKDLKIGVRALVTFNISDRGAFVSPHIEVVQEIYN